MRPYPPVPRVGFFAFDLERPQVVTPEERAKRGYPERVCARSVSDDEWSSQLEAAAALGISLYRVGYVIATGNLEAAENPAGEAGVTRGSLDREIAWRREAGSWSRLGRAVASIFRWL
jgi:hypothetical protein